MKIRKILNVLLGIGLANGAFAASITFDLTDSAGLNNDIFSSSMNGINLTVNAYDDFDPTNSGNIGNSVTYTNIGGAAKVTQNTGNNNPGLGVNGQGSNNNNNNDGDSAGQIDGAGSYNDALVFSFDQEVELVSVVFTKWGSGDDFHLVVNKILTLTDINDNAGNPNPWTWNPGSSYVGSSFGIGADGSSDKFRVSHITVQTSGVPESGSTFALLGLGLLGLGVYRRRM